VAQIDPDKERQRLARLYAGMASEELGQIASDSASLTDIAREVLAAELTRRGMQLSAETAAVTSSKNPSPPPPVRVARFRDLPEAEIAKSVLDSAGIESFLAEENIVRLDWFYSNLVGGIKLLVRAEDADAARQLLEQNVPEKFEADGEEYEQPRCPQCQSWDVAFDGLDRPITYAVLYLGLPVPVTNRGWKCRACGYRWDEDRNDAAKPKQQS
jgi:hypothetical protein